MRRNFTSTLIAIGVALSLAATACGSSHRAIVNSGQSPVVAELASDADLNDLRGALAPCVYDEGEAERRYAPAAEHLSTVERWLRVESVEHADRDGDGDRKTLPASITATDPSQESERPAAIEVTIHASYWDGIDWALEHGHDAYLGTADRRDAGNGLHHTLFVMVRTADGRLFFPGSCQDEALFQPLEQALGADMRTTLESTIGRVGADIETALGLPEAEEESDIVILNPEEVSEEFLASLQFALLVVTITEPLTDPYTICTRSSAGWNDCFVPDAESFMTGAVLDAYVAQDGHLEFWLMDEIANLEEPILLLGTMSVPTDLRSIREVAARVDLTPSTTPAASRVETYEVIDIADLDPTDEAWSPLVGPGATVRPVDEAGE